MNLTTRPAIQVVVPDPVAAGLDQVDAIDRARHLAAAHLEVPVEAVFLAGIRQDTDGVGTVYTFGVNR